MEVQLVRSFFHYQFFSLNDCYSSQKSNRKVPFPLITASELLTKGSCNFVS